MKNLFVILFLTVSLLSCKEEVVDKDYLIFGHFYGECVQESCILMYKVEDTRLLADTKQEYPNQQMPYVGNFTEELSSSDFQLARELKDLIPDELFDETNHIIGQPDAADQGGLYLEYNFDGERRFWYIDQNKGFLPQYLHDFIDEINNRIFLINE
jgi:hypothetical protein